MAGADDKRVTWGYIEREKKIAVEPGYQRGDGTSI